MRWYVEFMQDSVELPRGETAIGRDVGCALRFNDPSISRRHLRFIRRLQECYLEDLGSSNGTILNGRAVQGPMRIHDGDVITLGSRVLTIRVESEQSGEPMPDTLVPDAPSDGEREANVFDTVEISDEEARRHTGVIARVPALPGNQRCPQCAVVVNDTDETCVACGFRWGVRPRAVTLPPIGRRRHERTEMQLRLVYVSEELEIEATTRDLSASGVFVCSQILDPVGTACRLMILLDGAAALEVTGVVRRVVSHDKVTARTESREPTGFGVEFTRLDAAARAWLERAIARMAPADVSI